MIAKNLLEGLYYIQSSAGNRFHTVITRTGKALCAGILVKQVLVDDHEFTISSKGKEGIERCRNNVIYFVLVVCRKVSV